jgi:multicopper oxidase
MDGVHDLTQPAVEPGSQFTYRFTAPDPGTYWFHPHMGLELDRGLYAPLIVDDPHDPVAFDVDATLMIDDWLDGYGRTQEQVLAALRDGGGHSGHMSSGSSGEMAGMGSTASGLTGDVTYPLHVVNGRAPTEREVVRAVPGQRVRLRLVNAGSDTAYRVGVGGHRLTVTHADGFPVDPVEVDTVVLGMGERYDVIVTALSGAFPIVAKPEGKADPSAEAVLVTVPSATMPAAGSLPVELAGRALAYRDLVAVDAVRLPSKPPDRTETIMLTANASGYSHGINGKSFPGSAPVTVHEGERLRLNVVNDTMMFHPIHLHGHTFQLASHGSARKDTVNVLPMTTVTVDIEADNPGQWMLHCHNTYHLETGMATVLSYRA